MKLNESLVVFTGGGTGGHIYPGIAVADEIKQLSQNNNCDLQIVWLGCSTGMDCSIVKRASSIDRFYGIPSGKLRRYFSFKNFTDLFRIFFGFVKSYFILKKLKPCALFSKGGFVSVPPVISARLLKIPVYTHECDFTLGLANKINFKSAKKMFVSYEETKLSLSGAVQNRVIVTGNPVRPVFYNADPQKGYDFLNLKKETLSKPVLLVLGGSSGAIQINELVQNSLEWLCKNFIVIHQTGLVNCNQKEENELQQKFSGEYKPYPFIYEQMPDVLACSDVILSRAGANSIWEAAVLKKPMVLVPLCGSGTRGDQVDNARFFEQKNAAKILVGNDVTSENLIKMLSDFLDAGTRKSYSDAVEKMCGTEKPARKIAEIIFEETKKDGNE